MTEPALQGHRPAAGFVRSAPSRVGPETPAGPVPASPDAFGTLDWAAKTAAYTDTAHGSWQAFHDTAQATLVGVTGFFTLLIALVSQPVLFNRWTGWTVRGGLVLVLFGLWGGLQFSGPAWRRAWAPRAAWFAAMAGVIHGLAMLVINPAESTYYLYLLAMSALPMALLRRAPSMPLFVAWVVWSTAAAVMLVPGVDLPVGALLVGAQALMGISLVWLARAETRLVASRIASETVAQATVDLGPGVLLLDRFGTRVRRVSRGMADKLQIGDGHTWSGRLTDVLEVDERTLAEIRWQAHDEGVAWRELRCCPRGGGAPFWARVSFQEVALPDRGEAELLVHFHDIQGLREARAEALAAAQDAEDASEAKSRFLASMSHEIRTPMNGVMGLADLLARTELAPMQREYVDSIQRSGEALLGILNQILDLSRVEAGEVHLDPRPTHVADLLADVAALFKGVVVDTPVVLNLAVAPGTPEWVEVDDNRLRQVLVNLVGNALKFTSQGSVTLSVSADGPAEGSGPHVVRFSVRDTGIGIKPEAMQDLFHAFRQADRSISRRYGGTGLGLAISHGLVRLMQGELMATSELGVGSEFFFTLPLASMTGSDPSEETAPPLYSGGEPDPLRVLLVEDNAVNRLVAKRMLQSLGVHIDVVHDGGPAVERTAHTHYDVVLMDMEMPELDGVSATRQIRARGDAHQPWVVALTANAMMEDKTRCLEAGMNDFLAKPVSLPDLQRVLARVPVDRTRRIP